MSQETSVRVRMYRQGLGDCFLLTFRRDGQERHVLIDCGVFPGTDSASERMRAVAEDLESATGGDLEALVATHEHWDHLSGFLQAREVFDRLQVKRVWLAWTEDADDPQAARLRQKRHLRQEVVRLAAEQMREAAQELGRSNAADAYRRTAEDLDRLHGFAGGDVEWMGAGRPMTTRAMLDFVAGKGRRKPRFLEPGDTFLEEALGVRVYVLGPPRDERQLRRDDPREGEVYGLGGQIDEDAVLHTALRGAARGRVGLADAAQGEREYRSYPFDRALQVPLETAKREPAFAAYFADADRRIDYEWLDAATSTALKLDDDTNNTSLSLAFELPDGQVLLFPGDAQVGHWESWASLGFAVREPGTNQTRAVTVDDLLRRTVLYKVSHHGSHNATPRDPGLETMTDRRLVAMLPTDEAWAREKKSWEMPEPELHRALKRRTRGRVLRADRGWPKRGKHAAPAALGAGEWEEFVDATGVGPLYVEYTVRSAG